MKKLTLLFLSLICINLLYAQESTNTDAAVISFSEESFDFGDIEQGEKVKHVFKFENKGKAPLILSNVLTQCGCTATNWPRDPIAPGKSGEIEVSFNSAGKMGVQNKVVTIVSNASNSREKVNITTNVTPKKDSSK